MFLKSEKDGVERNDGGDSKICEAVMLLRHSSTEEVLSECLGYNDEDRILNGLLFDHVGLLVMVDIEDVRKKLSEEGVLGEEKSFPSVIVKARLESRNSELQNDQSFGVNIYKLAILAQNGIWREIELFLPVSNKESSRRLLKLEIDSGVEEHLAFRLESVEYLALIQNILLRRYCLPDGGGINQHEGTTTLYFKSRKDGRTRVEIIARGIYAELVENNISRK